MPIPWEADKPSYGFGPGAKSWLPQPTDWGPYSRDAQEGVPGSTLELYRSALALRAEHGLGAGSIEWLDGYGPDVLAMRNGAVTVIVNFGDVAVELPLDEILLASEKIVGGALPADTAVWLRS